MKLQIYKLDLTVPPEKQIPQRISTGEILTTADFPVSFTYNFLLSALFVKQNLFHFLIHQKISVGKLPSRYRSVYLFLFLSR